MSDPFYRTETWRRLRAACLRRDPVCTTPGCGAPATEADHITPRAKGGADALWNLRGLCKPCHGQRRRGGEPRARGCDESGQPRDPGHWWNNAR
jgi:5-methylcytosine-specific restriction endonuclease McrA